MSDNVYDAPESELKIEQPQYAELASRWRRLGASIIDGLIMMVVIVPVMFLTGGLVGILEGAQPSIGYNLLIGLVGIIVFVVINGKFLVSNGQTVGKKLLRIKIVDAEEHSQATTTHLVKRYALYFGIGNVPIVGGLLSLINILFIFGGQKRCLHDLFGATVVINA